MKRSCFVCSRASRLEESVSLRTLGVHGHPKAQVSEHREEAIDCVCSQGIRVTLCGISEDTTSLTQRQHGGVNLCVAVVAPQLAHSDFVLLQPIRCGLLTAAPSRDLVHSCLANLTSSLLYARHPYWKAPMIKRWRAAMLLEAS